MPEYYVHILNWGPIQANNAEDAAKEANEDIANIHPTFSVTPKEIDENLFEHEEFDSEEWYEEEKLGGGGN